MCETKVIWYLIDQLEKAENLVKLLGAEHTVQQTLSEPQSPSYLFCLFVINLFILFQEKCCKLTVEVFQLFK